jgi:hypothetical protein
MSADDRKKQDEKHAGEDASETPSSFLRLILELGRVGDHAGKRAAVFRRVVLH